MNTSTQVDAFFGQFQAFSFKAEDLIIHAGEKAPIIYYLKSGIVKQSAISQQGQESTITFYKPGAFFPLVWAVQDKPVPYDFRAVTNGHGWSTSTEKVTAFLKQNAEVTYELCLRLLSGLEGMSRKAEFALQATASLRVREAILTLAYRFGNGEEKNLEIELTLTHHQLAEITGLSRETVTRELTTLRDQNLIQISNKFFTIPSLTALEATLAATPHCLAAV